MGSEAEGAEPNRRLDSRIFRVYFLRRLPSPTVDAESSRVKYIKLIAEGSKRHLATADQAYQPSVTLCGRTITRLASWKQISSLEGDECPACSERAFADNGLSPTTSL